MGLLRLLSRTLFGGGSRPAVRKPSPGARHQGRQIPGAGEQHAHRLGRVEPVHGGPAHAVLKGRCYVIDGDTIVVGDVRIRIAGIDAPEIEHPWGRKAKWALVEMCKGQILTVHLREEMSYGRFVATCHLPDGRDVAAELVRQGLALDWARYSGGRYRHLEPPDSRRRLWRADARQNGRMPLD